MIAGFRIEAGDESVSSMTEHGGGE